MKITLIFSSRVQLGLHSNLYIYESIGIYIVGLNPTDFEAHPLQPHCAEF